MNAFSIYPMPKPNAMSNRVEQLNKYLRNKFELVEYAVNLRRPYKKSIIKKNKETVSEVNALKFSISPKMILNEVDMVFAHTAVGGLLSLLMSKKLTIHLDWHGVWEEEFRMQHPSSKHLPQLIRYIEKKILSRANSISVVTEEMREYLGEKYKLDFEKIVIAPNGYEKTVEGSNENNRAYDDLIDEVTECVKNKHVILYAGGSQSWQGLDRLYAASKIIQNSSVDYVVVICGVSKKLNVEGCVIEVPRVPQYILFEIMKLANLFVIPRPLTIVNQVAMPTKLVEYASVGRAILSTPIGATSRMVMENNLGIVTIDDSEQAIADGIIDYFEMTAGQQKAVKENNINYALQHSWSNAFYNLEHVL
jgi:glycosyltransferase involved in cell wall biosynthesis